MPRKNSKRNASAGSSAADRSGRAASASKKKKDLKPEEELNLPEGEYVIERLLGKRQTYSDDGPVTEYKVKWLGYPMNQCTWEPHWQLPTILTSRFDKGLSTSDVSSDEEDEDENAAAAMAMKDRGRADSGSSKNSRSQPAAPAQGILLYRCAAPSCKKVEIQPCEFKVCQACQTRRREVGSDEPVPRYCSQSCQLQHWPIHKQVCGK